MIDAAAAGCGLRRAVAALDLPMGASILIFFRASARSETRKREERRRREKDEGTLAVAASWLAAGGQISRMQT